MSLISFTLDQCETSDHHEGPWREIVDGKTARWIRVKQTEWDAAIGPDFQEREGVPTGQIMLAPGEPLG